MRQPPPQQPHAAVLMGRGLRDAHNGEEEEEEEKGVGGEGGRVSLSWMGEVAGGRWLAVRARWRGGCEVRLLPLGGRAPPEEGGDGSGRGGEGAGDVATPGGRSGFPGHQVLLPWQDEWDVHQVRRVW